MNVIPTELEGSFIIEPDIFLDDRGYFMESFNEMLFESKTSVKVHFVQDNQSHSTQNVLRGLHYQTGIYAQAKLVRVLAGEVLDVAVDIRPGSKTYGKSISVILSAQNQRQLFIPRGFAHGFLVLSKTATFFYKCDNFYNKESEGGIFYGDPAIGVDWKVKQQDIILSDKDKTLPSLKDARTVW